MRIRLLLFLGISLSFGLRAQHIVPDSIFHGLTVYKVSVLTPILGEFQAALENRIHQNTSLEWCIGYRNRWGELNWGSTASRLSGPYVRAGIRKYTRFEDWFFQVNAGLGMYQARPGYVWDLGAYFEPQFEDQYLQRLDCFSGYGSLQFGKPLVEKSWQVDVYAGIGLRSFSGLLYARSETYLSTGMVRQDVQGAVFRRVSPMLEFNIRIGLRR